jgi:Ferritin-like domain/TAT (twin-arginine translocation) pathway signal sequence
VVDGSPGAEHHSRRQLLLAGGSGAAAVALAGCGGTPLREKVRSGSTVSPRDIQILNGLLDLEYHTVAAYTAGIPLLHPENGGRAAKQFLGQEIAHAVALGDLIRKANADPRKPRASYDLGDPRTAKEVLGVVHDLERAQLSAYLSMIPRLSNGKLRAAVAAVYANDAQHVAVLRSRLGLAPAPEPIITASE